MFLNVAFEIFFIKYLIYIVYFLCMNRNETPQLYTVLPERRTGPVGAAMMASTHIYEMSAVSVCTHVCETKGLIRRSLVRRIFVVLINTSLVVSLNQNVAGCDFYKGT